MVALYGFNALNNGGGAGVGTPSISGWLTGPCPVIYTTKKSPGEAGCAVPLAEPSALFKAAKSPGFTDCTWNENTALGTPFVSTIAVAAPAGVSSGISKLICVGLMKTIGAGRWLIFTVTPASITGNGILDA